MFGGVKMSALLVQIGEGLTGVTGWFTSVLAVVETAITTSLLLQILLAVMAVYLGFAILKKVIGVIRSFVRR